MVQQGALLGWADCWQQRAARPKQPHMRSGSPARQQCSPGQQLHGHAQPLALAAADALAQRAAHQRVPAAGGWRWRVCAWQLGPGACNHARRLLSARRGRWRQALHLALPLLHAAAASLGRAARNSTGRPAVAPPAPYRTSHDITPHGGQSLTPAHAPAALQAAGCHHLLHSLAALLCRGVGRQAQLRRRSEREVGPGAVMALGGPARRASPASPLASTSRSAPGPLPPASLPPPRRHTRASPLPRATQHGTLRRLPSNHPPRPQPCCCPPARPPWRQR